MPTNARVFSQKLAEIWAADGVMPLRKATMAALACLGISAAYFIAPLTRDPRIGRIITTIGLPWSWEKLYRARLYLSDPLPDIAMERLEPLVWPDDIKGLRLDRKQQRFMELAASHGLGRGIGVACFGPEGRSGFLGCPLNTSAPVPSVLMRQQMHAIGNTSFQAYCRLVKRAQDAPLLSNRELEVLHWIGRGKSNSVIAEILGISPSSVDVYVRRIFGKLGVTDRTTASVKAYAMGLLVTADYEKFVNETRVLQEDAAERKAAGLD
ncbi:MAG: LuxR family transcriptional regulator [Alteraurantiacibacter sp.]|nr:LuxR family transcriptional regulator [Alteraurantiacibacter sp.]